MNIVLDDGTGVLQCFYFLTDAGGKARPYPRVPLGALVRATGSLYHRVARRADDVDDRTLTVSHIRMLDDSNEMMLHWARVMKLYKEVYSKPPVVQPTSGACVFVDF